MRSTRRSVLQGVAAAGLAARLGGVVARATVSEAGKPFGGGRRRWTAATAARTRPIGPERIESGWWDRGETTGEAAGEANNEAVGEIRRDYFIALSHNDGWLWIFRDVRAPGGWFLHGFFS